MLAAKHIACDCSVRLVAVVRAWHPDSPPIDAFDLDSRQNAAALRRDPFVTAITAVLTIGFLPLIVAEVWFRDGWRDR
jgi:hypothetical protein